MKLICFDITRGELKECDPSESAGCFIVEGENITHHDILDYKKQTSPTTFPPSVIKGETADVTRGCTGITNEELYKCSAHEVGNQVVIVIIIITITITIIIITIIVVIITIIIIIIIKLVSRLPVFQLPQRGMLSLSSLLPSLLSYSSLPI